MLPIKLQMEAYTGRVQFGALIFHYDILLKVLASANMLLSNLNCIVCLQPNRIFFFELFYKQSLLLFNSHQSCSVFPP